MNRVSGNSSPAALPSFAEEALSKRWTPHPDDSPVQQLADHLEFARARLDNVVSSVVGFGKQVPDALASFRNSHSREAILKVETHPAGFRLPLARKCVESDVGLALDLDRSSPMIRRGVDRFVEECIAVKAGLDALESASAVPEAAAAQAVSADDVQAILNQRT
ncbi:hypothetical protein [Ramlibacter sp.]|uniref:hypothetical protein n=1 Tax=Ramlibacter sp. TaxID=1917967 RepID=UPI003D0C9DDF